MYYIYGVSGPSLLIESTDSMIYILWQSLTKPPNLKLHFRAQMPNLITAIFPALWYIAVG